MKPEEIAIARIEALHQRANPTVQRAAGAQFALTLSMIAASQEWAQQLALRAEKAGDAGPVDTLQRDHLYTPEMVGKMAQALQDGFVGDVQLLVSWVETMPPELVAKLALSKRKSSVLDPDAVPLAQAAVLAKRYHMLDEIRDSAMRVAA